MIIPINKNDINIRMKSLFEKNKFLWLLQISHSAKNKNTYAKGNCHAGYSAKKYPQAEKANNNERINRFL